MAVHSSGVIVELCELHAGEVIGKALAQKQCKRLIPLASTGVC